MSLSDECRLAKLVVSFATDSSISDFTASVYSPLHSQHAEQLSNRHLALYLVGYIALAQHW